MLSTIRGVLLHIVHAADYGLWLSFFDSSREIGQICVVWLHDLLSQTNELPWPPTLPMLNHSSHGASANIQRECPAALLKQLVELNVVNEEQASELRNVIETFDLNSDVSGQLLVAKVCEILSVSAINGISAEYLLSSDVEVLAEQYPGALLID